MSKWLKTLLALGLSAGLIFTLAACGNSSEESETSETESVEVETTDAVKDSVKDEKETEPSESKETEEEEEPAEPEEDEEESEEPGEETEEADSEDKQGEEESEEPGEETENAEGETDEDTPGEETEDENDETADSNAETADVAYASLSDLGMSCDDIVTYMSQRTGVHDFDDLTEIGTIVQAGADKLYSDSLNFSYDTTCNSRFAVLRYSYSDNYVNAASIAQGAKDGNEDSVRLWDAILEDLENCAGMMDNLMSVAEENYHTLVILENNADQSRGLAAVYNGQVIYNCVG